MTPPRARALALVPCRWATAASTLSSSTVRRAWAQAPERPYFTVTGTLPRRTCAARHERASSRPARTRAGTRFALLLFESATPRLASRCSPVVRPLQGAGPRARGDGALDAQGPRRENRQGGCRQAVRHPAALPDQHLPHTGERRRRPPPRHGGPPVSSLAAAASRPATHGLAQRGCFRLRVHVYRVSTRATRDE